MARPVKDKDFQNSNPAKLFDTFLCFFRTFVFKHPAHIVYFSKIVICIVRRSNQDSRKKPMALGRPFTYTLFARVLGSSQVEVGEVKESLLRIELAPQR